ncbi:hypothetical protein JOQ06_023490, partial [Pogonophryne albipinna]
VLIAVFLRALDVCASDEMGALIQVAAFRQEDEGRLFDVCEPAAAFIVLTLTVSTRQRVIHLHCGDTCAVLTVRALTEREEGKQQPHDSKDTLSVGKHIRPSITEAQFNLHQQFGRSYRDVARSALPLDDPLSLKCRGIIGRRFERPWLQIDGRWGA